MLSSLDAPLLRRHACWFGGGTAIALRCGEFRESLDIDFLVADAAGFRDLRMLLRGARDLRALTREGASPVVMDDEVRIDRYGIRAFLRQEDVRIKFEIVAEHRIAFDVPGRNDAVCGVASLTLGDLAASKLLANADRGRDDSVFARDAIDLAMLDLPPRRLRAALDKATAAYGASVLDDILAAVSALHERQGWLERCARTMAIDMPLAAMHQSMRRLSRRLLAVSRLATP